MKLSTILSENHSYWMKRAEGYSQINQRELESHQRCIWQRTLCQELHAHFPERPHETLRILDIGCGPGFFSIILAEKGFDVTAIDLTSAMLREAQMNAGSLAHKICFLEMNAEELTFPDHSFDAIVSRNPNSGTCYRDSLKVSPGSTYGKLPDAKRKGFQFVGWFFSSEDGIRVTENTIVTISEDHTLYAHWTQSEKITLTLDPQGGRLLKSEEKLELYTGETYGYLPIPRRPGYNLDGWYTAPENGIKVTETSIFDASEEMTLYAHWIYDPFAYWTFVLQNTSETVYFCQLKSGYMEYDQDHVTPSYSSLLASTAVQNVAQNRGGGQVDDDWVNEKNPDILIKCVPAGTDLNKAAGDLRKRFPDCPVYVVPVAAENGTPEEQLYFRLYFAKLVYGEWFEEVDMTVVSRELGVSGSVLAME